MCVLIILPGGVLSVSTKNIKAIVVNLMGKRKSHFSSNVLSNLIQFPVAMQMKQIKMYLKQDRV